MRGRAAWLGFVIVMGWGVLDLRGEAPKPVQLFNGKDLTGWVARFKVADAKLADVFTARDGVLHVKGKPGGYIRTESKYTNYTLKLEWRYPAKAGNSGVLLRIGEPQKVWPVRVEARLASGKAGEIIDLGTKREHFPRHQPGNEKPPGEWNTCEVTFEGGELTLKVNGELQNVAPNRRVTAGFIGLQSEGAEIEFRNIELTPLPEPSAAAKSSATQASR
jgi:hypothetical protein